MSPGKNYRSTEYLVIFSIACWFHKIDCISIPTAHFPRFGEILRERITRQHVYVCFRSDLKVAIKEISAKKGLYYQCITHDNIIVTIVKKLM